MKANEITTLDQLADFINSKEDFPLEAFDIIEVKRSLGKTLAEEKEEAEKKSSATSETAE